MRHTSLTAISMIQGFEAFRSKAYQDPKGVWTNGWGHTKNVNAHTPDVTRAEAQENLIDDLAEAEHEVDTLVTVSLNQNQFDALVSLVFNTGPDPLLKTLGHMLNAGDYEAAANQFDRWVYCGSHILIDLVERREKEKTLFLKPSQN